MEALIYFLLVAALFAVMMRFGCGAHVLGHRSKVGSGDKTRLIPPKLAAAASITPAKLRTHSDLPNQ